MEKEDLRLKLLNFKLKMQLDTKNPNGYQANMIQKIKKDLK